MKRMVENCMLQKFIGWELRYLSLCADGYDLNFGIQHIVKMMKLMMLGRHHGGIHVKTYL